MSSESNRKRHLRRSYGLTVGEYTAMVDQQQGLCYVCKKFPPDGEKLCIDHSHRSGLVRKLLCTRCNTVLGFCDDRPELLRRLMIYLAEFGESFDFIEDNPETAAKREAVWQGDFVSDCK